MNTGYLDANHWRVAQVLDSMLASSEEQRAMKTIEILKPKLFKYGDHYCYLLGENLQDGVAGFGKTVMQAIFDFNKSINTPIEQTKK